MYRQGFIKKDNERNLLEKSFMHDKGRTVLVLMHQE
jgi:hypothetical protein